jgi:hypothetical protein
MSFDLLYLRNEGKDPVEVTVKRSSVGWHLDGSVLAVDRAAQRVAVRRPDKLPNREFLTPEETIPPVGQLFIARPQFRTQTDWAWAAGDPLDPSLLVGTGDYQVSVTWLVRVNVAGAPKELSMTSSDVPLRVVATAPDALKAMLDTEPDPVPSR